MARIIEPLIQDILWTELESRGFSFYGEVSLPDTVDAQDVVGDRMDEAKYRPVVLLVHQWGECGGAVSRHY